MAKRKMIDTSTREEDEEVGPSRTKLRADRKAKQAELDGLVKTLIGLPERKLDALNLNPNLHKEVVALRGMGHGSAIARQRRLVAKLLRLEDADAIDRRANQLVRATGDDSERHELERWRERLMTGDNQVLTEFLEEHPQTDRQRLRQILRAAGKEPMAGDRRNFRALYKFLGEARADSKSDGESEQHEETE